MKKHIEEAQTEYDREELETIIDDLHSLGAEFEDSVDTNTYLTGELDKAVDIIVDLVRDIRSTPWSPDREIKWDAYEAATAMLRNYGKMPV